MRAWVVDRPGPIRSQPLIRVERSIPDPAAGEILVRVSACGVCRTDLHLAEGDLAPRRPRTVPGHEVVGTVEASGPASRRFALGQRVGIPWLGRTCGVCRWCRRGEENLCLAPRFTGWDTDGGYRRVHARGRVVRLRAARLVRRRAPGTVVVAGIIGYRSLKRAALPPGGRLGHLRLRHVGAPGRAGRAGAGRHRARPDPRNRHARLALSIGVHSVGPGDGTPPEPVDAAILFAPAGELVPVALSGLDRGGTLALAGIHLTDVPQLNYQEHLFMERQVRSVTANTRADGEEFLALADRLGVPRDDQPLRPG